MDVKVPKRNTLAEELIERTLSMWEETKSRSVYKEVDKNPQSKTRKTLNGVKPVENITKNKVKSQEQKKVPLSHKLRDHASE